MPTALAHRGPNTARLAKRFFWKECRRLSVLAAGVSVLAMGLMLLVRWFTPRSVDPADPLSVIAVGAGMMLAVAAAVTLFSVEKEEGTADLLEHLPRNAAAMTAGKLGSAFVIVPLCTLALLVVAFAIGGDIADTLQSPQMASRVSLFLLEAFVWSLVASLACANPLVAAVLGIALASVSVQLGIFITNPEARGYAPAIFTAAMPARLALAGVGALIAGWLVSRWPTPPKVRHKSVANIDEPRRRYLRWPRGRIGLFGRHFWQTLRQSWTTAVVATLLGMFLTIMAVVMAAGILEMRGGWNVLMGLSALFAPAMLGAVVFRADQRRDAYRFLAEHAGQPRMLWLARNTVGLMLLAFLLVVLLTIFAVFFASGILREMVQYGSFGATPYVEMLRVTTGFGLLRLLLLVGGTAALVAYAWGQFFSLAVRSDVIAAMLALIASLLIAAWAAVAALWQLPAGGFLLPLAIGALLASLLRVRDWMFDRRGVWRWVAPIAVLVAPLGWIAWATPAVRLAQVDMPTPYVRTGNLIMVRPDAEAEMAVVHPRVGAWGTSSGTRFEAIVNQTQEELRLGREVAEGYERLVAKVVSQEVVDKDAVGEGMDIISIEPVEGAEGDATFGDGTPVSVSRITNGRFAGEDFDEFIRLSRIKCRLAPSPLGARSPTDVLVSAALIDGQDDKEPIVLDQRLERLLACRRISIQGENFGLLRDAYYSNYLADEFVEWATEENQTAARIHKVIRGLREAEAMSVGPIGLLMNEHYQARAIVEGKESPHFLQSKDAQPYADQWLAYFANESLGFERQRALKALDLLAAYDAAFLGEGMGALMSDKPSRHWLQHYFIDEAQLVASLEPDARRPGVYYFGDLSTLSSARSSGFASMVFDNRQELPEALRNWMASVAGRRAERVRLALIAYRVDHDEYPRSLDALVGTFLGSEEIHDPYTGDPFGWAPEGFEFPLGEVNEYQKAELHKKIAPAGTPTLWCGGSALAVPIDREVRVGEIEDSDDAADNRPIVKVMSLQPVEEIYSWPRGEFWLPVPK